MQPESARCSLKNVHKQTVSKGQEDVLFLAVAALCLLHRYMGGVAAAAPLQAAPSAAGQGTALTWDCIHHHHLHCSVQAGEA